MPKATQTPRRDVATAPASTFLRGLTMGALVGAAIAGTLLVGRRRRADQPSDAKRPGAHVP